MACVLESELSCAHKAFCTFHPYLFFFSGLQVRNNYRHYFLSSKALKLVYDVVTWAVTQLAVSYTVAPFVMLAVEPTISLYMYVFIILIKLICCL